MLINIHIRVFQVHVRMKAHSPQAPEAARNIPMLVYIRRGLARSSSIDRHTNAKTPPKQTINSLHLHLLNHQYSLYRYPE